MKFVNALAVFAATALSAGAAFAGSIIIPPTSAPEPGTLALLAGGVAAVLMLRRKK